MSDDDKSVRHEFASEYLDATVEIDKAVCRGLVLCCELFHFEVTTSETEAWISMLSPYQGSEILRAFVEVARTFIPTAPCPFPVPAHIIQEIERARQ
jgi:hypothetical protein